MNKIFTVTIIPENIAIPVAEGTNLLMAAKEAGIDIASPCGGHGTCGRCTVKLISGAVGGDGQASLPDDTKQPVYISACQAKVIADVVIEVPQLSRLTKHKVLLANNSTVYENDYLRTNRKSPIGRKLYIKLDVPDMSDNLNDADRVRACLSKTYGINNAEIGLDCLRKLPEAIREGHWEATVTLVGINGLLEIVNIEPGLSTKPVYGMAVDIGTTTVAVTVVDMDKGKAVGSAGTCNRQSVYGADVISRIIYADENPEGLELLHRAIIDTINELAGEVLKNSGIDAGDISVMICAGNTVMSHFFLKIPVTYLRLAPYVPAATKLPAVRARDLRIDINPGSPVAALPCVASYVGGDITSGVLATMITRSEMLTLFIDIGTNGELVLGNKEWLVTCSCSAGPAFEGSGISCGMRAMKGAIDRIEIDMHTLDARYSTIGDTKPIGICGSGLINSLSELLEAGIIDRAGRIFENNTCRRIRRGNDGMEYIIVFSDESGGGQDLVITEGDIKNLLRAKGAIFAGVRSMLKLVQMDVKDIDRVYIAGGFGNSINITDAINIGLLPDMPADKFKYVGNSSLEGALIVLLCDTAAAEVENIADRMTYLELSDGNRFMDEFISALFIPHTDLGLFPSAVGTV